MTQTKRHTRRKIPSDGRGDGVAGVRWDPCSADPFELGSIGAGPVEPVLPDEHRRDGRGLR